MTDVKAGCHRRPGQVAVAQRPDNEAGRDAAPGAAAVPGPAARRRVPAEQESCPHGRTGPDCPQVAPPSSARGASRYMQRRVL